MYVIWATTLLIILLGVKIFAPKGQQAAVFVQIIGLIWQLAKLGMIGVGFYFLIWYGFLR